MSGSPLCNRLSQDASLGEKEHFNKHEEKREQGLPMPLQKAHNLRSFILIPENEKSLVYCFLIFEKN